MKKIIPGKYKLINICLLAILLLLLMYMDANYDRWFKGPNPLDFYKYYYGIYSPIFTAGKWLAGILAVLALFPSDIFRKWLFYIAPIFLFLTYYLVQSISVYSTNLLNPTRGKMAENVMVVLGIVTVIFVASHLIYSWKKRRSVS